VQRPASGPRRLGRLKKCICISCEIHLREADGFTVELRIYRLTDVDLGGLNGDETYEPRPLLKTSFTECLTSGRREHTVLIGTMVKDTRRILVVCYALAE